VNRDGSSPYTVRSVLRTLDILDLLRQRPDGATLTELTSVADMPKSSVFRYLSTLESRGYVEREDDTGSYRLGTVFLSAGTRDLETLAARARPVLEELRDEFEETVNLGVLDASRVLYLEIVESRRSMRFVAHKGSREHLHSTALGKAIASQLGDEVVRRILSEEGMPPRTDRTITDPDEFITSVDRIRRKGFAIDDRENEPDGRCVAVPVVGMRPPAALSLSAPSSRFSLGHAKGAAEELKEAAERIAGGAT
jgi:IclR family transcriptional regulator, acetate operon repressor